jgi:hypothetical protein
LTPAPDPAHLAQLTSLWCIVCGDYGGADIAANLILFLPFAAGLRLAGLSWRRTVLCCAATSFTVELLQLVAIPGRDASLSDLLSNTTSGALGAALAPALPTAIVPSARRSLRLLIGGCAIWVGALALAGWLLEPSVPDGWLRSVWAPTGAGSAAFKGRVTAVRLDGAPMPTHGAPSDSADLRRRLEAGTFTLEADVTSGARVPVPSWIYGLHGPSGWVLTLFQVKRKPGVAIPVRALRFRSRLVTLTLPHGLPVEVGVPVHLRATERDGVVRLESTWGGVTREAGLRLSPAYGWRVISPFELAADRAPWLTAVCLAISMVPLGYWAGRARRAAAAIPWLAAALGVGLAVVPRATGFPPVAGSEWLAAGLGAVLGWALHRGAAYLERRCASPSASESSSS